MTDKNEILELKMKMLTMAESKSEQDQARGDKKQKLTLHKEDVRGRFDQILKIGNNMGSFKIREDLTNLYLQ